MIGCEECGRQVMTKGGVCFECSQIADPESAKPFPDRDIEYANLSDKSGHLLPRIKVVSPTSKSWTSDARKED